MVLFAGHWDFLCHSKTSPGLGGVNKCAPTKNYVYKSACSAGKEVCASCKFPWKTSTQLVSKFNKTLFLVLI